MRILALLSLLLPSCVMNSGHDFHPVRAAEEKEQVGKVLDALHHAAAVADGELYWSLYTPDAIFIGTDDTERWTIAEFHAYADRYFEGDSAWIYEPTERSVMLSPGGDFAWFDEKLNSKSYGAARGSGTLLRRRDGWKIAHYVLSFPIPNEIAKSVTDEIKTLSRKGGNPP